MTGVKALVSSRVWCHLPVCESVWKTDVWSAQAGTHPLCHSSRGRGLIWDLPSKKNTAVCRRSQAAGREPSVHLLCLPRLQKQEERVGVREGTRKFNVKFKTRSFYFFCNMVVYIYLPPCPKMSLLYNFAGPDLGREVAVRAFLKRVEIMVERCWMWSCGMRNAFSSQRERLDSPGEESWGADALQMSDR